MAQVPQRELYHELEAPQAPCCGAQNGRVSLFLGKGKGKRGGADHPSNAQAARITRR